MNTNGTALSVVTAYILLATMPIIGVIMVVIISRHYKGGTLESPYFKQNYGTLTEGLRLNSFIAVYWNIIILLRWTLTIIVIV